MADKNIDPRERKHLILCAGWCLLEKDHCFALGGLNCADFTPKNKKKMIQITWHCALLIIAVIISFIWAITRDNYNGGFLGISSRDITIIVWIILTIILFAIYGGIFWW